MKNFRVAVILLFSVVAASAIASDKPVELNYLSDYPAINADGSINAVIEIPAGSVDKWEVEKKNGTLQWEIKDGEYRKVKYLGYPANYGMIPSTLLPAELGGDGDPLDIIVLGEPIERGSVVRCHIIGMLQLLDGGEQDDKLIAVVTGSDFSKVTSMGQLNKEFPGVSLIIETWFSNYKGPGKMKSKGFKDKSSAQKVLSYAVKQFKM